jgi:predicted transcriptional regulator
MRIIKRRVEVQAMIKPKPIEKRVRYMKRKVKDREILDTRLRISDMVITDEFVLAEHWDTGKTIAEKLLYNPGSALLVKKGKKIIGVVNEYNILQAIADGRIEVKLRAEDLMTKEIMEVREDAALEDILPELYQRRPYAVIVTDTEGKFKGYFSPKDSELAAARLKIYE